MAVCFTLWHSLELLSYYLHKIIHSSWFSLIGRLFNFAETHHEDQMDLTEQSFSCWFCGFCSLPTSVPLVLVEGACSP